MVHTRGKTQELVPDIQELKNELEWHRLEEIKRNREQIQQQIAELAARMEQLEAELRDPSSIANSPRQHRYVLDDRGNELARAYELQKKSELLAALGSLGIDCGEYITVEYEVTRGFDIEYTTLRRNRITRGVGVYACDFSSSPATMPYIGVGVTRSRIVIGDDLAAPVVFESPSTQPKPKSYSLVRPDIMTTLEALRHSECVAKAEACMSMVPPASISVHTSSYAEHRCLDLDMGAETVGLAMQYELESGVAGVRPSKVMLYRTRPGYKRRSYTIDVRELRSTGFGDEGIEFAEDILAKITQPQEAQ